MLSSRGALNTSTLLVECAAAQSKTSNKIFLLSEAEKVWAACSKVLRSQLIQNIPVCIPKVGALWFEPKLIVTDGPLKYFQRVPHFGFHHTFVSTYGLDDMGVPLENPKTTYERIPMDQVTALSGVGAQTATMVLHEIFLYIGEGLFNGKVLNLEFPGLMNIVMKREKAIVQFDDSLLDDLFAIDSRKWSVAVREMAAIARAGQRPSSALQSRPDSARPRSSSSSSRPATQPKPLEPRPAFVSSNQTGRLFSDIKNLPVRQTPKPTPRTRGARQPLRGAAVSKSIPEPEEEESVYEVLSPERHNKALEEYDDGEEVFVVDDRNTAARPEEFHGNGGDDGGIQDALDVVEEEPVQQSRPASSVQISTAPASRGVYHQPSTVRDLLYGAGDANRVSSARSGTPEPLRVGRKRFGDFAATRDNLGYLFSK